jgi:hypothetical protein
MRKVGHAARKKKIGYTHKILVQKSLMEKDHLGNPI